MKSKRVNLSILCVLSLILLVSNSLQAMTVSKEVKKNTKKLLKDPKNFCKNKKCNLKGAQLRWAILREAILTDADLSGAILTDVKLIDADFSGAILREANFEGAKGMTDKDLINSGAIFKNTTLPSGKKHTSKKI